jgi:hypothetical protein
MVLRNLLLMLRIKLLSYCLIVVSISTAIATNFFLAATQFYIRSILNGFQGYFFYKSFYDLSEFEHFVLVKFFSKSKSTSTISVISI